MKKRICAALLAGKQDLSTRRSLRERQGPVLLDDERLAQRDHKGHAQKAADQRDEKDRHQTGRINDTFLSPQEQRRKGEDRTGCNRLTG